MAPNYDEAEVQGLIDQYSALRELRGTTRRGLWVLVRMADLSRAIQQLPFDQKRVVLLHGLIGLSETDTAELLSKSRRWVDRQYRWGVEDLVFHMNGGFPE